MNLIILGAPGSGKGTQAKLIAEKFGLTNISSGQLLREFAKGKSEKAILVADILATGALMPFDTVVQVIQPKLLNSPDGFILDGTPRDVMQAEYLDWFLGEHGLSVDKVIFLRVPREIILDRLSKRAAIEHRSDDTPNTHQERLNIYEKETVPVIEHYRKQGKLIEVDGTPDIETIFKDIVNKLESK